MNVVAGIVVAGIVVAGIVVAGMCVAGIRVEGIFTAGQQTRAAPEADCPVVGSDAATGGGGGAVFGFGAAGGATGVGVGAADVSITIVVVTSGDADPVLDDPQPDAIATTETAIRKAKPARSTRPSRRLRLTADPVLVPVEVVRVWIGHVDDENAFA